MMKNPTTIVRTQVLFVILLGFVTHKSFSQTYKANAKSYRYEFREGKPIIYNVTEKSITSMKYDLSHKDTPQVIRIEQHVNFKLTLMPEPQTEDRTLLQVSCKDIHAKWDLLVDKNRLLLATSITGEIQGTFNSKPITLADDRYSKEIEGLYTHGTIIVNELGKIISIEGDDSFRSYWERWERLIPLVFPASEISIGGKWQRHCPVGKNQGIEIPTEFLEILAMERVHNQKQNGMTYSSFNLTGYGQDKTLKSTPSLQWLQPMEVNTTGTILFDDLKGRIAKSKTNHRVQSTYLQKADTHSVTVIVYMDRTIEMTNVPQ